MFFILAWILTGRTFGHLILNIPQVWGVSDGITLEEPLDESTTNWVCAGRMPDTESPVSFVAGREYTLPLICGEKDFNATWCLPGDWHTGNGTTQDFAGCAMAITYDDYKNPLNYKYLAYTEQCPVRGANTRFIISPNAQNCERCVCSWAWAPSRDYSSPAQFYHNCFYCSITGGLNVPMKPFDFINVNGAQYVNKTYRQIANYTYVYARPAGIKVKPRRKKKN
jgi:hypothetical protein